MNININNALSVIIGLLTIIGAIYRLAQIEANINDRINKVEANIDTRINKVESTLLIVIDQLKDNFTDRLYIQEKKLDIHLAEYSEKKMFAEYRFNATDKLIEHKFKRLANWIKQISGFLNKESGFQIRDDEF